MSDPTSLDRDLRRCETILESLEDGVYAVDDEGVLVYLNERYAEMKNTSQEALLGTHVYDWVTPEAAARAQEARAELERGETDVGIVEYEFQTADGETFPVEMRFDLVADDDIDRVGVIRDITARKRREESLRKKNARLDAFASIVSHDLRNPLNVATGRIELLKETGNMEHLDAVERAHDRMEALIDDLLALARAGEGVESQAPVALQDAAETAWRNVSTGDATLQVTDEMSFIADANRLRELFENLIRNATEHASETTAVTVTVGPLDDGTGFYVADNGTGIPASEREAVFESGYTTTEHGTGFGLNIVERITDAHGWAVTVTTSETGGARFVISDVEVV